MRRLLIRPGRTEIGVVAILHDRNLVVAVDHLRDVDVLQVVGQPIVKRFQTIDLAFNAIELGEALAEIERLGFPLLDVGLEVFHLLADGFPARVEFLDRVAAEKLDQLLLLRDLVVQLENLRMFRAKILGQRVALGLEQLDLLLRLQVIRLPDQRRKTAVPCSSAAGRVVFGSALWPSAPIKILVEIEQVQEIVLGLERGVLLIQLNEIGGGAVSFFLNEPDVVLLLELEHFVFALAQILLDLDQAAR